MNEPLTEWSSPAEGRKYLRLRHKRKGDGSFSAEGATWYVWISAKRKWSLKTTELTEACRHYDRENLLEERPRNGAIRMREAWPIFLSEKDLRPSTRARWQSIWEVWISTSLGTHRLAEVQPENLIALYQRMTRADVSHVHAHKVLSTFFKFFSEMPYRYRPDNPCRYVGERWTPKRGGGNINRDEVVLSDAMVEKLARHLEQNARHEPMTKAVLATIVRLQPLFGCRISEMLGLKLTDLKLHAKDPDRRFGEIHIERQRAYDAQADLAETWFAQTKTETRKIGSQYRSITVTAEAEAILAAYIDRGAREGWLSPGGLLFPNSVGKVRSPHRTIEYVTAAHRAVGSPATGTHCFRHTAAANWIAAGMPIERVATLLGDTIATVIDCYGHLADRSRTNAENELWMTRSNIKTEINREIEDTQSIPSDPQRVVHLAQAAGFRR